MNANHALSTLYVLKDDFRNLFTYTYEGVFKKEFRQWYFRATHSRIPELIKFAHSLNDHLDGITAHCRHKINTSVVEGINNKAKVIKRIAYGYRDMEYYFLKLRGHIRGISLSDASTVSASGLAPSSAPRPQQKRLGG